MKARECVGELLRDQTDCLWSASISRYQRLFVPIRTIMARKFEF